MTKDEISEALITSLRGVQEDSGREVPSFTDDLCPLLDLPGFESLNGEEVALDLEERLKCKIGHHAQLFFDEKRPLTIAEMVDWLYRVVGREVER